MRIFIIYPLIICDVLTLGNISSRAFSWDSLTQFPHHLSSPGCAAVSCLYHHRWPLHQHVGDGIFVGFSHIPLTQPISNDFTFWFTPLLLKKNMALPHLISCMSESKAYNFLRSGINTFPVVRKIELCLKYLDDCFLFLSVDSCFQGNFVSCRAIS